MAFKMFYLLVYPLAVLGALAVAKAWLLIAARRHPPPRGARSVAWSLLLMAVYAIPKAADRVAPAAGRLDRIFMTPAAGRADNWNPPASTISSPTPIPRTGCTSRCWATRGRPCARQTPIPLNPREPSHAGSNRADCPYAVVDMRALPHEVLSDVDVLEEFGDAAVVKRRGPSFCADAQRFAATAPTAASALHRVDDHRVVPEHT